MGLHKDVALATILIRNTRDGQLEKVIEALEPKARSEFLLKLQFLRTT